MNQFTFFWVKQKLLSLAILCSVFTMLHSNVVFAQDADNYYDTTKWISPDIPRINPGGRLLINARPAQTLGDPTSVNPDIPQSLLCQDLRVVFILDESGSINGPESETVRKGAKALANALLNSGATLQLVEFSSLSHIVDLGGTAVNSTFISNLNDYLGENLGSTSASYNPGGASNTGYNNQTYNPTSGGSNCIGWTNWEDALQDITNIDADLIMFFTDGNPTAYNVVSGGTLCSGQRVLTGADDADALPPAITQANIIKGQGKHMFLVGVGSDLNLSNIQAISGTDAFGPDHNILTADYTTPPFDELASDLTQAVNAICGTVLTIDKSPSSDGVCAGQTVVFTHTLTNTGGDFGFTANNVVVTDVYPNGYSNLVLLAPIPAGANITGGNTVNIPVGDMIAGATLTYQVQATVDAPPGDYNSIVTATAFNADQVSDNAAVASGQAQGEITVATCSANAEVNGESFAVGGPYYQHFTSLLPPNCDSLLTIYVTSGGTVDPPVLSIVNDCSKSIITAKDGQGNLIISGLTWSNGASGNPIEVTSTDAVTATVTDGECTSDASNSVTPAPKSKPAAPQVTVTDNCDGISKLCTDATGNLLWSTTETSPCITVSSAGTYKVTTTVDGCTSDEGSGDANPKLKPATPQVTVTDYCNGTSKLCTDATGNLLWSTTETTSCITVSSAGTYKVTTTVNGCTSDEGSGDANPKSKPATPQVTVTDNCDGTSKLCTDAAGSLLWNTTATTPCITVSSAGTYKVTTTVNGCTSDEGSGNANPKTKPAKPNVTVTNNCDGTSRLCTNAAGSLSWNTGATTSCITVTVAGLYSVTTKVNGCESAPGSCTAAPKNNPTASISCGAQTCAGGVAKFVLTANVTSGASIAWGKSAGADGSFSSTTTSPTTYTPGPLDIKNGVVITLTATLNGCCKSVTKTLTTAPCGPYYTYTQGYCGSTGSACTPLGGLKTSGTALIQYSLDNMDGVLGNSTGQLYLGKSGASFTVKYAEASKLSAIMPGGGTATKLLANYNLSATASYPPLSNGRINNVLLSQTITLAINTKIPGNDLGGFILKSGYLTTQKRNKATCPSTVALHCSQDASAISSLKITTNTTLMGLLNGKTVNDLLNMASAALGGTLPSGVNYSDINNAVDVINKSFDEGRFVLGYYTTAQSCSTLPLARPVITSGVTETPVSELTIAAYPNPFTDRVSFSILSPVSGKATIAVYDMAGRKIATVYSGNVLSGKQQLVECKMPSASASNLIYQLTVGDKKVNGKLVRIK